MAILLAVAALAVVVGVAWVSINNGIVTKNNRCDNAWQTIDAQLQRRNDLIPNLVETVKGYAAHESTTLQNVTDARAAVMGAQSAKQRMEAENALEGTLKSLFAVSENYPDLKANQNFLDLQAQLSDTEDKISYMRQSYNDTVMKYNNAIQTFPGVLFAGIFHFEKRNSFDAAFGAEVAPQVSF